MQYDNGIVNYFVSYSGDDKSPKVYRSPITVSETVARSLIAVQFGGETLTGKDLMHICYDSESGILYSPNWHSVSENVRDIFIQAVRLRILKDFKVDNFCRIIRGSPYSSIRKRSISSFPKVKAIFKDLIDGEIEIWEVNLTRMPSTVLQLPRSYQRNVDFMGGYIEKCIDFIESIDINGKSMEHPVHLASSSGPFILINTSSGGDLLTATDKEWAVIQGVQDYLATHGKIKGEINESSDLYAIRHHLMEGWHLEEVCSLLLRNVDSFENLIIKSKRLALVISDLKSSSKLKNTRSYYISIGINEKFPINLKSMIDASNGSMRKDRQIDYLRIIDFDVKRNNIIIETPIFISPSICSKVFNTASEAFICCYNPLLKRVDIKANNFVSRRQAEKILEYIQFDEGEAEVKFIDSPSSRGDWSIDPYVFNVRKMSDYINACDYITNMSKSLGVEFRDLDVIIGPVERIMGKGSQGGFVQKLNFDKTTPYYINEDAYLNPPCILINSVTMPSYSEQAETLVHEYRHYIYSVQNPFYEIGYGSMHDKSGDRFLEEWDKYMSDDNEKEAHKEEIKYSLLTGKSIDEIIRDKVGGKITLQNYPIALRYRELINEVNPWK